MFKVKKTSFVSFKSASVALLLGATLMAGGAHADEGKGEHMMEHGEMMKNDQMMEGHGMSESQHREVMGVGMVNKIHADRHMVNISHEPIAELKWPKMRMNFKTDSDVDLSSLKLGQKVQFMLEVDGDNNYLIREIKVVE
ncbi:copper-binding protein [Hahella ganghwensis]|uniref:copper-binding protein n=1 Tax=Hahella ganghwensis TaxID=286420 RepID=UPI00037746B7|nr:copper-binding protein [Hahella ganghwensis]